MASLTFSACTAAVTEDFPAVSNPNATLEGDCTVQSGPILVNVSVGTGGEMRNQLAWCIRRLTRRGPDVPSALSRLVPARLSLSGPAVPGTGRPGPSRRAAPRQPDAAVSLWRQIAEAPSATLTLLVLGARRAVSSRFHF